MTFSQTCQDRAHSCTKNSGACLALHLQFLFLNAAISLCRVNVSREMRKDTVCWTVCVQFMLLNFSFSTTEPCNVKITGTCIYEALQYPDDFLLMCCPETVSCSVNAWTQCLISDSSFTKLGTGLSHSICPSLYFEERKKKKNYHSATIVLKNFFLVPYQKASKFNKTAS